MFPSPGFFVWFSVLCGMVVMQAHFGEPSAEALTRKARAPLTGKTHSDQELNQKWLNFLNKFKKLKKIDLQQGMVTDAKKHHINKMANFLTTHLKKQLKPNDKLKLKVVEKEMGHKISYLLKKYFEKKLIPKGKSSSNRVKRSWGWRKSMGHTKKPHQGGRSKGWFNGIEAKIKKAFEQKGGGSHRRPGSATKHHGRSSKVANQRSGGWGKFKPHPASSKRVKRGWFNGIEAKIKKAFKQKGGGSHRRPGSATKHHGRLSKVANQRSGGWGKTFNPHPASSKGANRGWLKKILSHHPKTSSKRVKRSWFQREKSKWHTKKPQQGGRSKGMPCDKVDQCRNGGTCSNFRKFNRFGVYYGKWMYYCACPKGFTGKDCERKIVSVCATRAHECLNGATCLDAPATNGKTYLYCNCAPGFRGDKCEKKNAGL